MFSFARHSKSKISNWWWTVDKVSFSLAVFLIFIGAMLVLSASPSAAHRDRLADDFAFIKKQGVFIFMGLVLMIGVSMQSLRTIRRLAAGHARTGAVHIIILHRITPHENNA